MSALAELNRGQTGSARVPPLVAGDHLTRDEFERRYHAMPNVKKAELIVDSAALLRGDMATVLNVVRQGIETPEHAAFAQKLAAARRT